MTPMRLFRLTLRPRTAFGTPLAGDTLFGQLCWTLRHQHGNDRLNDLLAVYTAGRPFAVVSDGLPHGFLPLPHLPSSVWDASANADRKTLKKKTWLPVEQLVRPLPEWQQRSLSEHEVSAKLIGNNAVARTERAQPHNSLNRLTGTTGEGAFAPYAMPQLWFHPAMCFDLYVALDESRLSLTELGAAFDHIGQVGFGRDASIGLGKFERIGDIVPADLPTPSAPNAWLTLGPCAPQGLGLCPQRSFYKPLTRFGRHGDAAVQSGNPFKRPVLLAQGGAVFRREQVDPQRCFIGQGIGGVSSTLPETVHQGYCPALPILVPEGR